MSPAVPRPPLIPSRHRARRRRHWRSPPISTRSGALRTGPPGRPSRAARAERRSSRSRPTARSPSSARTPRSGRASRRRCRCSSPKSWTWTGRWSRSSRAISTAKYGTQSAGGSTAVPGNYDAACGRSARPRARCWSPPRRRNRNVPEAELTTASGRVTHAGSKRSVGYGELAAKARAMTPPDLATREAQGSEGLQDHRPARPGRRPRRDRHRQADVRHRHDRARHALRRVREVPGVRAARSAQSRTSITSRRFRA